MATTEQLLENLIHYCLRTGNWEPELDSGPIRNVLASLEQNAAIAPLFEMETAFILLSQHLEVLSSEVGDITDVPSAALRVLRALAADLGRNIETHWILVPLRHAHLPSTIKTTGFQFIEGDRADKVDAIRRLSGASLGRAQFAARHMEASRSPGFFDHPLLAIRVRHQFSQVERLARFYALMSTCALLALYWGYGYAGRERGMAFMHLMASDLRSCDHLMLVGPRHVNWRMQPLKYNLPCRANLSMLETKANRDRFRSLFSDVIRPEGSDLLSARFLRGLRLFGKALSVKDEHEVFEGLGLQVLYLMVAAETVLLDGDQEKRCRLIAVLSRLVDVPSAAAVDIARAVDSLYRLRSDFVHAGEDQYPSWDEDLRPSGNQQQLLILQQAVARLLSDAPTHLERATQLAAASGGRSVTSWFSETRGHWNTALGL